MVLNYSSHLIGGLILHDFCFQLLEENTKAKIKNKKTYLKDYLGYKSILKRKNTY